MPQIPPVQFQDTSFVSILRTDLNEPMKVYHTNSACTSYQYYQRDLPTLGHPFMGDPVECIFCQRLNEQGK
jgi:hypothetical protein